MLSSPSLPDLVANDLHLHFSRVPLTPVPCVSHTHLRSLPSSSLTLLVLQLIIALDYAQRSACAGYCYDCSSGCHLCDQRRVLGAWHRSLPSYAAPCSCCCVAVSATACCGSCRTLGGNHASTLPPSACLPDPAVRIIARLRRAAL